MDTTQIINIATELVAQVEELKIAIALGEYNVENPHNALETLSEAISRFTRGRDLVQDVINNIK